MREKPENNLIIAEGCILVQPSGTGSKKGQVNLPSNTRNIGLFYKQITLWKALAGANHSFRKKFRTELQENFLRDPKRKPVNL